MHRSSKEAVWWLSPSGYSWQARICERTVDGMACRPSGAEYKRMLPQLLFLLHARRMDLRVYFDSDKLTGMSIEIVLPDIRLAVDMESERKTLTKERTAKLHVCEAKHYDYILLKACSDPKAMAEQILRVFKMKHIFIPTNVDEDILKPVKIIESRRTPGGSMSMWPAYGNRWPISSFTARETPPL